jgi:hypothetical protein
MGVVNVFVAISFQKLLYRQSVILIKETIQRNSAVFSARKHTAKWQDI